MELFKGLRYLGGKRNTNLAKSILDKILENREPGQYFVEPFIGGANIMVNVTGNRIGADRNPIIILLLKALQDGWLPPKDITKEDYIKMETYIHGLVNNPKSPETIKKRIAQLDKSKIDEREAAWFSLLGHDFQFMGGYPHRTPNIFKKAYDDLFLNGKNEMEVRLRGVKLYNCNYWEIPLPPNSIIYCDPPYSNTTGYKDPSSGTLTPQPFNNEKFWKWCIEKKEEGHTVFVSEESGHAKFKKIDLPLTGRRRDKEKLYVAESHIIKWENFTYNVS